jgi:hypothetical protein
MTSKSQTETPPDFGQSELSAFFNPLAQSRHVLVSTNMSRLQSQILAALEEAQRARQTRDEDVNRAIAPHYAPMLG